MGEVKILEAQLKDATGDERLKVLIDLIISCMSVSSKKAIKYCEQAVEFQASSSSVEDRIKSFQLAAKTYMVSGDYKSASKHLIAAKDIADEFGDPDQIILVSIFQSEFFLRKGEYQNAVELLEKTVRKTGEIENGYILVSLLNHLGIAYDGLGKYDATLEYYFKALDEIEKSGTRAQCCSTHINIGNTYSKQDEFEKAYQHYTEAMQIAEELNNESFKSSCLSNIGGYYFYKEDYGKALGYFLDLEEIYKRRGFKTDLQDVQCNIVLPQLKLEFWDRNLRHFSQEKNDAQNAQKLH